MKSHKGESNFDLGRSGLAAQTRRTTDALRALEQTAARLSSSLSSGVFRASQSFSSPERLNGLTSAASKILQRGITDEQSKAHEDFSFSPPNGERVGLRGQFERSKTEEVFSTELLNRLAREFNTTVSSARSRDGSMPASPVTSLERMGFVFNSGSSRADDHARSTAENTRKTVLLLERIEKKNPSGAGENTFSHIA